MLYTTGSRDDWDNIGKVTEDPAWTWDAMGPYRDRNQKYVPPSDGHDDVSRKQLTSFLYSYRSSKSNQYLPSAHSHNGTLCISLPGSPQVTDPKVIATLSEPGFSKEFPFQRDMNTGDTVRFIPVPLSIFVLICFCFLKQIGVGWIQATVGGGRRCSSATTYVGPEFINRPNLHILLHAQATKILEAVGHGGKIPKFNGVEFATGPSSKSISPTARFPSFTRK